MAVHAAQLLDLISNIATIVSTALAAISAKLWWDASNLAMPVVSDSASNPPAAPQKTVAGIAMPVSGVSMAHIYADVQAALAHERNLREALMEGARLNARAARWAMLTALALAVALAAGLASKVVAAHLPERTVLSSS